MSLSIRFATSLFVLLIHTVFGAVTLRPVDDYLPAYKEYVKKAAEEWRCPGVSVAIFANGKVYFINHGTPLVGSSDRITENSVFCILSCSKIVTVILLQQLVDEGKISLEDRVIDHLPWFKLHDEKSTAEVKIKHLISHCIGLPAFCGDTFSHFDFSAKEVLDAISTIPLKHPVGKKYGYQNVFVGIAGMLIEKVTGRTLNELMSEQIFKRLEMSHSSLGPHYAGIWDKVLQFFKRDPRHTSIVSGHQVVNGQVVQSHSTYHYVFSGTSGINSTTSDYVKLVACLVNKGIIEFGAQKGERLFSTRAWDTMSSPQTIIGSVKDSNFQFPVSRMNKKSFSYGNGMFRIEYGENGKFVQMFSHMGAGSGWRSFWAVNTEHRVGIVIFSNLGSVSTSLLPESLGYKFIDMCFDFPEEDWSATIKKKQMRVHKLCDNQYERYVLGPSPKLKYLRGTYRNSVYGELKVSEEKGSLVVEYRGNRALLGHIGGAVFRAKPHDLNPNYSDDEYCTIYFSYDKSGNVNGLHINLIRDGSDFFERVS
jgi:CubicO group peptidase (beta-lactamase class C family)